METTKDILGFLLRRTPLVVPKRYPTLMRTPKDFDIPPIPFGNSGHYLHFGIQSYFLNSKYLDTISHLKCIHLNIGIDEIQFFASSKLCGCPIIGQINDFPHLPPFFFWNLCRNQKVRIVWWFPYPFLWWIWWTSGAEGGVRKRETHTNHSSGFYLWQPGKIWGDEHPLPQPCRWLS